MPEPAIETRTLADLGQARETAEAAQTPVAAGGPVAPTATCIASDDQTPGVEVSTGAAPLRNVYLGAGWADLQSHHLGQGTDDLPKHTAAACSCRV